MSGKKREFLNGKLSLKEIVITRTVETHRQAYMNLRMDPNLEQIW